MLDKDNTTIIGSKGWFQDKLHYVIGKLNLTIETRDSILQVEGGNQSGGCTPLLFLKLTDICSEGTAQIYTEDFALPIPTLSQPQTLLAGVHKHQRTGQSDIWALIEIFHYDVWIIFSKVPHRCSNLNASIKYVNVHTFIDFSKSNKICTLVVFSCCLIL